MQVAAKEKGEMKMSIGKGERILQREVGRENIKGCFLEDVRGKPSVIVT